MKQFYSLCWFLLLIETPLLPQGWQISNNISGSQVEPKFSCIDNQNNTYILTSFLDTVYKPIVYVSLGRRDILLNKINNLGNILWSERIGSDSVEICGGITTNNLGEILITGGFSRNCTFSGTQSLNSSGNLDVFLANYSESGTPNWSKRIAWGSKFQVTTDIISFESSIVITGYFTGTMFIGDPSTNVDTLVGNTSFTSFISKFDQDGNLIWCKSFSSTSNNTSFRRVTISENGYYFGGSYQGSLNTDVGTLVSLSNSLDMFLYKTDLDGNGEWIRSFKGESTESFRSLETDEFDNAYVLGSYSSLSLVVDSTATEQKTYNGNLGGYATFIAKYNRSGIMQWLVKNRSTTSDYYYDIAIKNNIIYSSGYFANQIIFNNDTLRTTGNANRDAFLGVFNQIGDPITGESIRGTGDYEDAGISVSIDNSSKAYIVGSFKSPSIFIGDSVYFNSHYIPNPPRSDLFFAIYQHPFRAVITDEDMVSCNGLSDGMLRVTPYFGRAPFTYAWSHDANLHDPLAENLPAGDYTVTITDANNTEASIMRTVSEPPPLDIASLVTDVTCFNAGDGAIDITVTGGTITTDYVYNWTSLDGSGIEPLEEDQTGLTNGTYTIVVRDDNNCPDTADILVTQPQPFNYAGTLVSDIVLPIPPGHNGAVDVNITGGNEPYTFAWTGPGAFNAVSEDINDLGTAGLYNLHLTDDKSCSSDTSFAVIDDITFIAQVSAKTNVLCFGQNNGSATVDVYNGTPPYSYQWSDGVTIGLATRTNMAAGPYTVLVTDGAMNAAQAAIEIEGPSAGLVLTLNPQDLMCFEDNSGVVDLTVSNGTLPYQFLWNTGHTGEDLVNVPIGLYTITVTDGNNCNDQNSVYLVQPAPIGLDIDVTAEILCHGENTGALTANALGGLGTFSYLWDDPGNQTTKTAFDLLAGNYTVTATDENGCSRQFSQLLDQPDSLSIQADVTDPACTGDNNGSIVPVVSGGTPVFSYVWSNNVFVPNNANLSAGLYSLTVRDENNCTISAEYQLDDPLPVTINSVDSVDISCYGLADGIVTINASGGTGDLFYSADDGANYSTSMEIESLDAGTHIIIVKDSNDCESTPYPVQLLEPDPFVIDTIDVVYIDATHPTGSISLENTGGIVPISFFIVPDSAFNASGVFDFLAADNYKLFAMDADECKSNEILVSIPAPGTGLTIYDAFSPNGDGKNDVWHIRNIEYYPNCSVKIFNTWGIAVFSSKGYGVPWDGKYNGNELPSGTYYYVLNPGDGSGILTGPVSIVK